MKAQISLEFILLLAALLALLILLLPNIHAVLKGSMLVMERKQGEALMGKVANEADFVCGVGNGAQSTLKNNYGFLLEFENDEISVLYRKKNSTHYYSVKEKIACPLLDSGKLNGTVFKFTNENGKVKARAD